MNFAKHYCRFALLIFIGLSAQVIQAEEAKSNKEREERATFIKKAMESEAEALIARANALSRRGISPFMSTSTLKPFGDWDYYYVDGVPLSWTPNPGQKYKEVVVPTGFVTDLTSIPQLFWQILRPEGRYAFAAVVHDYLYWKQERPRDEADQIFRLAMLDSKVKPATVTTIYTLVRKFGQSAWDENKRRKKKGERRILKEFPKDYRISWSDWKQDPNVFTNE